MVDGEDTANTNNPKISREKKIDFLPLNKIEHRFRTQFIANLLFHTIRSISRSGYLMVVYGLKLHTKHKNISALLFNRCEHW